MVWEEIVRIFRKGREGRKKERGQSSNRSMGNIPDTSFYDSIGLQENEYRHKGTVLRNDSSNYSLTPAAFDNPIHRRSAEFTSYNRDWYDPEATNYEYSQIMANLTRKKSRSPERRSLPRTPLGERRVEAMPNGQSKHVSLRDYVPKVIQDEEIRFDKPFYADDGNVSTHVRNPSPSRRSLPRTPIENRKTVNINEPVPHQHRPSYRRSRSYDPDLSTERRSKYNFDDDCLTVDRHRNSNKRYIKNSQKTKNKPQQSSRDKSTKGKLQRQNISEASDDRMWNYGISPDYDFDTIGKYRETFRESNVTNGSILKHGSHIYSGQIVSEHDRDGHARRGHRRSRRDRKENSPNRNDRYQSYRCLPGESDYVFHQTKL